MAQIHWPTDVERCWLQSSVEQHCINLLEHLFQIMHSVSQHSGQTECSWECNVFERGLKTEFGVELWQLSPKKIISIFL